MQEIRLKSDEIVIGCTLSALLFAYMTNRPFLFKVKKIPTVFEYFEDPLSDFFRFPEKKIVNSYHIFKAKKEVKVLGPSKMDVFNRLYFLSSLWGLNPFGERIDNLRFLKNCKLKVTTIHNGAFIIPYKRLFFFDLEGIREGYEDEEVLCDVWYHFKIKKNLRTIFSCCETLEFLAYLSYKDDENPCVKDEISIKRVIQRSTLDDEANAQYVVRNILRRFLARSSVSEYSSFEQGWKDLELLYKSRQIFEHLPACLENSEFVEVIRSSPEEIVRDYKMGKDEKIFFQIFNLGNKGEIEYGSWKTWAGW